MTQRLLEGIAPTDADEIDMAAVQQITGLSQLDIADIERQLSDKGASAADRKIFWGVACWLAREGTTYASAAEVFQAIEACRNDPAPTTH